MQVTTQAAQQKPTTSDSTYSTVNLTFPLLSIFGEVRTDLSKPAFSEGSRVVLIKFRCQCAKSPGKFFEDSKKEFPPFSAKRMEREFTRDRTLGSGVTIKLSTIELVLSD